MGYAKILLTEEQRKELTKIPDNVDDWRIVKYYTLNDFDISVINKQRKDYNRIGFALQLCCLRYPGWTLTDIDEIPRTVILHIANQLDADTGNMHSYGLRENTRLEHLQKVRNIYRFRFFDENDQHTLEEYLLPRAMENDHTLRLIKIFIEQLREQKIILPGITTIERIASEVSQRAETNIHEIINQSLTQKQKMQLEKLLESADNVSTTTLAYLRDIPGQSSPRAFMNIIEQLEIIRKLNLKIDFGKIHPNRIKQLSRLGSKYEPHSFRRFEEKKRYAMLAVYLKDLEQRLINYAVEIHDKQMNIMLSKGRKQQEEIQKQNGKSLNEKIIHYINIGSALIKSHDEGSDPFSAIESIMSWNKVVESIEDAKKLARPDNYDYLDLLDSRYNQLRKYTPALLEHLKFSSSNISMKPLIEALNVINDMNKTGKKKVPDDVPSEFVSNRWKKHVFEPSGSINRHYYEMVALAELKNRIRSGDIAVEGSRNYRNFGEYLMKENEWNTENIVEKLAVSTSFEDYIRERKQSIHIRLKWLSDHVKKLEFINLSDGKIHIEKLEKETPDEAVQLSESLYNILPRIKLSDLLLEVSNWTGFDRYFTHASANSIVRNSDKPVIMAALMAMGTNIGLVKMADSTPSISYHQMANTAQWRMYDEAMKRVQACLVNFQHRQLLPSYWGDGTTSSSDGMRIQVGVSSLEAEFTTLITDRQKEQPCTGSSATGIPHFTPKSLTQMLVMPCMS